jgi:micrococcal nuclease
VKVAISKLMRIVFTNIVIVLLWCSCNLSDPDWVTVKRVIDGDTFLTTQNETIRLIGIDAPESARAYDEEEYFADESANFLDSLITGEKVKLVFDRETYDVYDRTLAYVYTQDSVFVNALLLEKGMAFNFPVSPNLKYAFRFKQLENKAKKAGLGLWKEELIQ